MNKDALQTARSFGHSDGGGDGEGESENFAQEKHMSQKRTDKRHALYVYSAVLFNIVVCFFDAELVQF